MFTCGITGHSGGIGKAFLKLRPKLKIRYYKYDIRDKKKLNHWLIKNNLDYIIHLAAIVPIKVVNSDKKKAYQVNTLGTKYLIDLILKNPNKIRWIFFSSTSHVYSSTKKKIKESFQENPISFYGKTKLLAEKEIKRLKGKKIRYCIGRIFSTTNINQRKNYLVSDLKKKIKKTKKTLILKNLNHFRDFISIDDVAKIIHFFLKNEIKGTINIASGKKTKLSEIACIISRKYKKKIILNNNNETTRLVANNSKLKKIYKQKLNTNIKKMIFN